MPYDVLHAHKFHIIGHTLFKNTRNSLLYYIVGYYIFLILITTFQIPLIYRITASINGIILSQLIYFIWIFLGYAIFYAFKLNIHVVTLFRASIAFQVVMGLYSLFFYSKLDNLSVLIPIFAIQGVSVAMYAIAYHVSILQGVANSKRDSFMLNFRFIYGLLPVVLPVLGGVIIQFSHFSFVPKNDYLISGYFILFLVATIVSALLLVFSPHIAMICSFHAGLSNAFACFFNKDLASLRNFLLFDSYVGTMKGLIYGLLGFIILVDEFNLGSYSSAIALTGAVYFLYIKRLENKKHIKRINFYRAGLLGDILSQAFFFLQTNFFGLLARSLSDTFLGPLRGLFGENIIRHKFECVCAVCSIKKVDLIMYQEAIFLFSRMLALMTVFAVSVLADLQINQLLKYFILLFAILDIFVYPLMRSVEKESA